MSVCIFGAYLIPSIINCLEIFVVFEESDEKCYDGIFYKEFILPELRFNAVIVL